MTFLVLFLHFRRKTTVIKRTSVCLCVCKTLIPPTISKPIDTKCMHLTYVTAHFPTLLPLYVHHGSFYNPSIASPTSKVTLQPFRYFTYVIGTSPTSQLISQPFRRFTYITAHSTTLLLLHLPQRSFYNPSVDSPTSQALHVLHLAIRPWIGG